MMSVASRGAACSNRALASSNTRSASSALESLATTAAAPSGAKAALVRSRWVSTVRVTASYSAAANRSETARLIAMNGVGSGTSISGSPADSAASIRACGVRSCVRPTPSPTPLTPALTSRPTNRSQSPSPRRSPVVSTSSPPSRYGVGSASSLTATHRTGASIAWRPARSTRSRAGMSRTVRTVGRTDEDGALTLPASAPPPPPFGVGWTIRPMVARNLSRTSSRHSE